MKVWIIAESGYETYYIHHICITEESAKKRYNELKEKMYEELKDRWSYDWNDAGEKINSPRKEELRQLEEVFGSISFENQRVSGSRYGLNIPICDVYNTSE